MRLPRVVPKIGLTIVLGVTIVQSARAGGTNDERLTGFAFMRRGSSRRRSPTSTRCWHSHNRDLEILIKTRLVLSATEPAAESARRLRPGESVQRLGVAGLWPCTDRRSQQHLVLRADCPTSLSRKAGGTAASPS